MLLRGTVSEGGFLRILVNGGYICLTDLLPICFFILFFFWRREGVFEVMRKVPMENILFDQVIISNGLVRKNLMYA